MFDALKQVLVSLQLKVGSSAPAEGAAKRVELAAQKADKAFGALRTTFLGVFAVGAIRSQINAVVDGADKQRKYAEALGVGVEQLQRWTYAAELSGLAADRTRQGLAFFSRAQAKAGRGSEDLAVLLEQEADAFAAMPDGPAKTARAMELFGRGAVEWIPLLNRGAAGIRAMGAEAEAMGIVLSEDAARSAEAYNDSMLRLRSVFRGVRNTVVLSLIPGMTRGAEAIARWARDADRVRRTGQALTKMLATMSAIFAARKVIAGASLLAGAIRSIGSAGALASAKMALFVGGLVLLALLLEDLYVFAQGGDSLIGRFLGDADAEPLRAALREAGQAFEDLWLAYKPAIIEGIRAALLWLASNAPQIMRFIAGSIVALIEVVKFLGAVFSVAGEAIGISIAAIYLAWQAAVEWMAQGFADLFGWLDEAVVAWDTMGAAGKIAIGMLAMAFSPLLGMVAIVWGLIEAIQWLHTAAVDGAAAVFAFLGSIDEAVFGWMRDQVNALIAEIKAIVRMLPDVAVPDSLKQWADVSTQELQASGGFGGAAARMLPASAAGQATANVGAVSVQIQGTTDMDSGAVTRAVDEGIHKAINDMLESALEDLGATA